MDEKEHRAVLFLHWTFGIGADQSTLPQILSSLDLIISCSVAGVSIPGTAGFTSVQSNKGPSDRSCDEEAAVSRMLGGQHFADI